MRSHAFLFILLMALSAIATQQTPAQRYNTKLQFRASIVPGTTDVGNHCDNCTTKIALPFAYRFYGVSYNSANVSSNGNIQFTGNNDDLSNTSLPNVGSSDTIFLYWQDLGTEDTAGGQGIFTSVSGVAPYRVFNIEWRTRLCCGTGAPDNIFEVRLVEGHQTLSIIYGRTTTNGKSMIAGVQKDNTDFTKHEFDTAGTVFDGRKVTFSTELIPALAGVSISGRVLGPDGRGLQNALVHLTGVGGIAQKAITSPVGDFRFDDIGAGQTYIVSVRSEHFTYASQIINLFDSIRDLTLLPLPDIDKKADDLRNSSDRFQTNGR